MESTLGSAVTQGTLFEVELVPAQRHELGHAEQVAISEQNWRSILETVSTQVAGGVDEALER